MTLFIILKRNPELIFHEVSPVDLDAVRIIKLLFCNVN